MIEWRFTPEDVTRIRLVISPLTETVLSLIVLRSPAEHALHLPWVRQARARVADLDLTELLQLVPARGPTADFLTPPPTSPMAEFDDELDRVNATSPVQVMADVEALPHLTADQQRSYTDAPEAALSRLTESLAAYWKVALREHWPRLRALLQADVIWRSRQLAEGGFQALFGELHETINWEEDRLSVADPWQYRGLLTGEGLILAPSAMVWPGVRKMIEPYQPMMTYPTRGVGTLWEAHPQAVPAAALAHLMGRSRAQLLIDLSEPRSTSALAARFRLTPSAVSQHLHVLLGNGLVSKARSGHSVLYHRTPRGDALAGPEPPNH